MSGQSRAWLRGPGSRPRSVARPAGSHRIVLVAGAYLLLALALGAWARPVGALFHGLISPMSSASATAILASIASGMMALTGIVFSLVLVGLQLGSSTYSPRVVRVMGQNRVFGHAFGIFTGTFVYALLAIRAIDLVGQPGVNIVVVTVALAWLLASVVALILLLSSVRAMSIANVLATLQRRTTDAAMRVYSVAPRDAPTVASERRIAGMVRHSGPTAYLVGVDVPQLVALAARLDVLVVVPAAIGDAMVAGNAIATIVGASPAPDPAAVRRAFWLASSREIANDPAYGVRLLVDIAIRALSPAVNDPTTAVCVLDELDGVLRELSRLALESDRHCDARGVVRLIRSVPRWDDYVALALTEIQDYGRDSIQIQHRLGALLRDLEEVVPEPRREALRQFARSHVTADGAAARKGPEAAALDRQGLGHAVPDNVQRWWPGRPPFAGLGGL